MKIPTQEITLKPSDIEINGVSQAATNVSLAVSDDIYWYIINGSATLASNMLIQHSGTPKDNTIVRFLYGATLTFSGNNVTVFGYTIPSELESTNFELTFRYNEGVSAWEAYVNGGQVIQKTGSDTKLVSGTAGTTNYTSKWNTDGDLVDGYEVLDEDNMISDSDTKLSTQQAIKAYVDGNFTLDTATDVKSKSWTIDEDNMSSDSDTKVPTQQSTKAYVDAHNTISGALPQLIFKDTNCIDPDNNAIISVSATDTGSGAEDIDVEHIQQVGGLPVTYLKSDADANIELGDGVRRLVLKGDVEASGIVKDEDNMISDSAVHLSTQQAIKAYVDSLISIVQKDMFTVTVNMVGSHTVLVKMPFNCIVSTDIDVQASLTEAMSAAGSTIKINNNLGNPMLGSAISFDATDAQGTTKSATVTGNNDISADENIQIEITDSGAGGGKAVISIPYNKDL